MQRALKASVTRWITKAYEYEVGFLHAGPYHRQAP